MAECSKGTNSSHGEYSHKYNENQYHSTTPCAPPYPSDCPLLKQRRTHLLHTALSSPHTRQEHTFVRAEKWPLLVTDRSSTGHLYQPVLVATL